MNRDELRDSQRGLRCCTSDSHEGHASPAKSVYVDSISDSEPPEWDVLLDSPEPTDSEDRMNRDELREALIEVAERTTDHSTDLSPMAGEEIADALLDGPVGDLLAEVDSTFEALQEAGAENDRLRAENEALEAGLRAAWSILTGADGERPEPTDSEDER